MRNASGHQCKMKMSGSKKKVNEKANNISSIRCVTEKFWKFHVVVVQNSGKEMYKKRVLYEQSCYFAN